MLPASGVCTPTLNALNCRRWNPVQGGSWQNGPPQLVASSVGAASITTASVPRNWGGQELLDDVLMVTQTQLTPNVVKVRAVPE